VIVARQFIAWNARIFEIRPVGSSMIRISVFPQGSQCRRVGLERFKPSLREGLYLAFAEFLPRTTDVIISEILLSSMGGATKDLLKTQSRRSHAFSTETLVALSNASTDRLANTVSSATKGMIAKSTSRSHGDPNMNRDKSGSCARVNAGRSVPNSFYSLSETLNPGYFTLRAGVFLLVPFALAN